MGGFVYKLVMAWYKATPAMIPNIALVVGHMDRQHRPAVTRSRQTNREIDGQTFDV